MPFVFGMVLATLLIAAPAAHAACKSPKNICKHFDDCLQRTSDPNNRDVDGIMAGVKARNGQKVSRRHAPAIWVENSNGTSGRVGAQNSSLSRLLGWNWNSEKSIATDTHNNEPLDHLEWRLAASAVKREAEEDWGRWRWRARPQMAAFAKSWWREEKKAPAPQGLPLKES
jgi:hypothetical protein